MYYIVKKTDIEALGVELDARKECNGEVLVTSQDIAGIEIDKKELTTAEALKYIKSWQ